MTGWPEELNADQFFLRERLSEGLAGSPAVRLDDGVVDYGTVDSMASGAAAELRARGVGPGDRVLVIAPDGAEYVAALFATWRLGAVVVMLNPALDAESMASVVRRAAPPAAFVGSDHAARFAEALGGQPSPELIEVSRGAEWEAQDVPTAPTSPDDPAIWLFSGGTTGAPKAVVQTHKSLVNTARLYGQAALGLTETDITISVPKLYFGYATGSNLLFPFSVGASTVLFPDHPTPAALLERIERHQPTVLVNVPSAINQMLAHDGDADLSSLRFTTSAGEPLPESLYHRWVDRFGVEILDGLGTAEMWHIFITNTLGDVRPGTLGKVVDGFVIEARDDDENPVAVGEVGRLWVRGESLGLGYFGEPEKTAEAFRGEWFVGGDLVSIDEGGYVTHRGRADDAAKVKGKWFRPQELESVLLEHDRVEECAVITVQDAAGLNRPVAFVVPSGEVGEEELVSWCLERLEPYKHPRRVHMVDELPQTHLGKTDRAELRRLAGSP